MRTLTTTIKENWETDENELTAKLKDSILKRYADRGRLLTIIYSGKYAIFIHSSCARSSEHSCEQK